MLPVLSACDYTEIDKVRLVAGSAIDKDADGTKMTSEILRAEGGQDSKITSHIASGKGDTIIEMIADIDAQLGKYLSWSHSQVMIFDEELAKEGIGELISQLRKNDEIRLNIYLLVSHGVKAAEIFDTEVYGETVHSFAMKTDFMGNSRYKIFPDSELYRIIKNMDREGQDIIIPAVTVKEKGDMKTIYMPGTAVFSKDKLTGYLSKEETIMAMIARGTAKGTLVEVKDDEGNTLTEMGVVSNSLKVNMDNSGGKLTFYIDVSVDGKVENDVGSTSLLDGEYIKKLLQEGTEYIQNGVYSVLNKTVHEFNSDILGLGYRFKNQNLNYWDKISDYWIDMLKGADIKVNVDFKIRGSKVAFK